MAIRGGMKSTPWEGFQAADRGVAGRTALASLEGKIWRVVRRALLVRRLRGCERCLTRQPQLELMQEGTVDGTPQPIVPDFVEALGQHVLQKTADTL